MSLEDSFTSESCLDRQKSNKLGHSFGHWLFSFPDVQQKRRSTSSGQDSVVYTHLQASGHSFRDEDVYILDREERWFERGVKEAIFVKRNHPSLNRGGGLRVQVSPSYNAVIASITQPCVNSKQPSGHCNQLIGTRTLAGAQMEVSHVESNNNEQGQCPAYNCQAARHYCPHHVGHYLGMDVHDTPKLSRSQPLQPGMVITIEPGMYISEDNEQAPEHFRGLGVRIEDDVVIQDKGGPLILSSGAPKTIADVEKACAMR